LSLFLFLSVSYVHVKRASELDERGVRAVFDDGTAGFESAK